MREKYKVVFEGKFIPEISSAEIRNSLFKLYRRNQSIVDSFFTGKRLVLERGVDRETALKIQITFEKAGAVCSIVEEKVEAPKVFPKQSPAQATPSSTPGSSQYEGTINAERPQRGQEDNTCYALSLRGMLAESWNLIYGAKWTFIAGSLFAGAVYTLFVFLGYGITRFIGEPGRNLYVNYGLQYGFAMFAYPFWAGVFMLGVKRASGERVSFPDLFQCFTPGIFILSGLISLLSYMMFALLLSLGVDHFFAGTGKILIIPVFALTVPLIAEKGLGPLKVLHSLLGMFLRRFPIIAVTYMVLFFINLFGNFIIIGFIWTIPLFFMANGILFRNLMLEENSEPAAGTRKEALRRDPLAAARQLKNIPALEGNSLQNLLALLLIFLLLISAGTRLWALNMARKIYPPDHVAYNGNSVCIHADKTLFFLSPDGETQQRVELNALGIHIAPADIELLEDGSLLIGDMDKKAIFHCAVAGLSCRRIGPPEGYRINDNFKFLADEKRNLLFVADTNNHRLFVQDLEGAHFQVIENASRIDYPNDMALDEQGLLWVSNTLHNRMLSFKVENYTATETGGVITLNFLDSGLSAITQAIKGKKNSMESVEDLRDLQKQLEEMNKDPQGKGYLVHTRPLALAWGVDQNVWVAASDPYVTTSGIRVFNAQGKQIRSIHLGRGAIPEDIISSGETFLIADTGLFQVFSVQTDSGYISPFGDETFQRALTESRKRLEGFRAIQKWTGRGLWVLAIAAALLVFGILRKKRVQSKKKAV